MGQEQVKSRISPQNLLHIYAEANLGATLELPPQAKFRIIDLDEAAQFISSAKYKLKAAQLLNELQGKNVIQNWVYCRVLNDADIIPLDFLVVRTDKGVVGLKATSNPTHGNEQRNQIRKRFGDNGLSSIGVLQFKGKSGNLVDDQEIKDRSVELISSLRPILYIR